MASINSEIPDNFSAMKKAIPEQILFSTVVGSHMWGMNHAKSDIDYFVCYLNNTKDILLGKQSKSIFISDKELNIDISGHELGNVINQLKAGNYNFIIGIMSPLVINQSEYLNMLKIATEANMSKLIYAPINGMATQNIKKYIDSGIDTSEKRCNVISRALQFGITLFNTGKMDFKEYTNSSPEKVKELQQELKEAFETTSLPETPPNPSMFDDILLSARSARLKDIYII
ncbi:MAG: DNA polymerase beta superfamily protein [Gammaproteobacteria bacterium]